MTVSNLGSDTFFDIHLHAFDLSHPSFTAFLKRFQLSPGSIIQNVIVTATSKVTVIAAVAGIILAALIALTLLLFRWPSIVSVAASLVAWLALIYALIKWFKPQMTKMMNKFLKTTTNLLSVFENDIGSFFLIIENCLREDSDPVSKRKKEPHLKEDGLHIGKNIYNKVVLTPLMMDFGSKGKVLNPDCHYGDPSEKPIMGQVVDVFNSINRYSQADVTLPGGDAIEVKYPFLKKGTKRLFEVYPFLGINTQNYKLNKIEDVLNRYFDNNYRGSRSNFQKNIGQFDGHIEHIGTNFFAGVKVYPPLGFDPWPDAGTKDYKTEMDKVTALYMYCADRGIPITSHGGSGGFVAIEDKKKLANLTSVEKWQTVLEHYPTLKLNLAHFPAQYEGPLASIKPDYKQEHQRLQSMIKLIKENANVYTDFSCQATSKEYYAHLKNVLGSSKGDRAKLTSRIMFGSDYAVVLGSVDSYYEYISYFSETKDLTDAEKHAFCCTNPQSFLFK